MKNKKIFFGRLRVFAVPPVATGGSLRRHGPVLLLRLWQLRSLRWCFSVD